MKTLFLWPLWGLSSQGSSAMPRTTWSAWASSTQTPGLKH